MVKLNVALKNEMNSLRRLYSKKSRKQREAIIAQDIVNQRERIHESHQQIQCHYIKQRNKNACFGRLVIKMQYYWWVRDFRKVIMRIMAAFMSVLSVTILTVEVLFMQGEFQGTAFHQWLINQKDRSYFSQTVS